MKINQKALKNLLLFQSVVVVLLAIIMIGVIKEVRGYNSKLSENTQTVVSLNKKVDYLESNVTADVQSLNLQMQDLNGRLTEFLP